MGFWSGVRDGFVGAAKGTWDGVKGLAKGGYDLATDPAARERAWEATKSAGNAVAEYAGDSWDDPAKPFRDARDGANAAYNAADKFVRTADAEDWGKLAGAGVFEVGTALVPVGAVAKAGKLGKLGTIAKTADKVGDVADTATDAAKLADKATDAAKVADKIEDTADAVDNAADAAKLLDDKAPSSKKKCVDCSVSYKRPSGFRNGVRDEAWENAKGPDGLVRDPKTNQVMNKDDPWDMGHKPGYEFRKHAASAEQRGISRKQFLDEHNTPSHYRPELPSSNRSHSGELPDNIYYGP